MQASLSLLCYFAPRVRTQRAGAGRWQQERWLPHLPGCCRRPTVPAVLGAAYPITVSVFLHADKEKLEED